MEEELDATSIPAIKTDLIRSVWKNHEHTLRRSGRLEQDLQELEDLLSVTADETGDADKQTVPRVSRATVKYLQRIRYAGEMDREFGSALLLGHLYCRYFADLFGGQMLGKPYELALQLPAAPQHLQFDMNGLDRKSYLEKLYGDLNKSGRELTSDQLESVSKESILAFRHNASVYSEDPSLLSHAARGGTNLVLGWTASFWK